MVEKIATSTTRERAKTPIAAGWDSEGKKSPLGAKTGLPGTGWARNASASTPKGWQRFPSFANGEGKRSPLRRLPTDHIESLTQTGILRYRIYCIVHYSYSSRILL